MATDQEELTVIAVIKPGEVADLRALLVELGSDVEGNAIIPFAKLTTVHFVRWVILDQAAIPIDAPDVDIHDIDAALNDLTKLDPRMGRIVELRFFSELTVAEVAEVLGISSETVKKDWRLARAWLCSRLRSYE